MAKSKESDAKEAPKLNPEQSAAAIMNYLREVNRPYSAIEISNNISAKLPNRGGISKAAAAKLLKDMHERGELEGRSAGKQIVYHVKQDDVEEDFDEKMAEMDAEVTRLRENRTALLHEEKELKLSFRQGASLVPIPELKKNMTNLETQKSEIEGRLKKLRSGRIKTVNPEERGRITKQYKKLQKTSLARKKIRNELWALVKEQITDKDQLEDTKDMLGLGF